MDKLLVIDHNPSFLLQAETLLHDHFTILTAGTLAHGLEILRKQRVTALLLDSVLPETHLFEVLDTIFREIDPHLPVIVIADHADIECAVEAMRRGAYDFITKDFSVPILSAKILKALERRELQLHLKALQCSYMQQQDRFVFTSDMMKKLNFEITRLARFDFDVLLVGETGVGKDLIAVEIHRRSSRSHKPFLPIAVRSLSETLIESELFGHEKGAFSGADRAKIGKFEAANQGTVYLPEIASLSEEVQLKLLSFMQYKTISRIGQDPRRTDIRLDVRLIMASNERLEERIRQGCLREDFYHRITGIRLAIPPLREHPEDIEQLAHYFIEKYSAGCGRRSLRLAPEALSMLQCHPWPGNVRELENAVKQAIVLSADGELQKEHFAMLANVHRPPADFSSAAQSAPSGVNTYAEAEALFRKSYFVDLLSRTGGNIASAARLASMTPQGVRKILSHIEHR